MGAISPNSPRRLRARVRREYVFQLRLRGASFREIAEAVRVRARREGWELPRNYDKRQAHQDLMRYQSSEGRRQREEVDVSRAIAVGRCNVLLRSLWPQVVAGKREAIVEARRLVQLIACLEGVAREPEVREWDSSVGEFSKEV